MSSSKRSVHISDLPLAHIRLFQREILKLITDKELKHLTSFLTCEQQEKLCKMLSNQKEYLFGKKVAFKLFSFQSESAQFFQNIIKRSRTFFSINLIKKI